MRTSCALFFFGLLFVLSGCGRYWVCDEVEASRIAELPAKLSETGLYADIATGELVPGVVPYAPRFALWSDGSDKRRWILLPAGARIDTSDMDAWVFPEGTRIWKEFSIDGVRVETRLLEKRGPTDGDWIPLAYVWDPDGHDATAAPLGEVDAHGSMHDVPAARECFGCHGGRRSFVLGFSAIQLATDAPEGELDLDALVARDLLSDPPAAAPVVPGDAIEVAALGYFHANCSHCHNQTRPEHDGARCFDPDDDYDFTLAVGSLDSVPSTAVYRTVVGDAVTPGDPDNSRLFELVTSRGMFQQMPPLATERVDADGVETIRAWIEGL